MSDDYLNTVSKVSVPSWWRIAALFVLLAAVGLSWSAMGFALRSLEDVSADRVEALAEIHETTSPLYRALPSLSEVGHPVAMDSAAIVLAAARSVSATAWRRYLATTLTEAEVALMNQSTGPVAALHQASDSLVATLRAGDHERFVLQMNEVFFPHLRAVAERMEALVALQQRVTRERVELARRRYRGERALLAGSVIIAGLLVVMSFRKPKREG